MNVPIHNINNFKILFVHYQFDKVDQNTTTILNEQDHKVQYQVQVTFNKKTDTKAEQLVKKCCTILVSKKNTKEQFQTSIKLKRKQEIAIKKFHYFLMKCSKIAFIKNKNNNLNKKTS